MSKASSVNDALNAGLFVPAYFRFAPLLKQLVWGGEQLLPFKRIQAPLDHIGESWEISCLPDNETPVVGGEYDGWSLSRLMKVFGVDLLGVSVFARFGYHFPLMVKFIDTARDLSIQVHPDDAMAHRVGLKCGKSEMWYVVKAVPGATLLTGFSQPTTPDEYREAVNNSTICEKLQRYEVKKGDSFVIPAGQIHSIGAGILLIEVQQMSDVTYRIFDYNRLDKDGKPRKLQVEEAGEAIHFEYKPDYRNYYTPQPNKAVSLAEGSFYTTSLFELDHSLTLDYSALDSFVLWVAFEGEGMLTFPDGTETVLCAGETILLPATTRKITVKPASGDRFCFLETHV